jgi:hypothetical protein
MGDQTLVAFITAPRRDGPRFFGIYRKKVVERLRAV